MKTVPYYLRRKKIFLPGLLLLLALVLLAGRGFRAGKFRVNRSPGSGEAGLKTSVLVDGLNYPWEIIWGPDQYIWMTERNGRVSRVNPANGKLTALITIPEVAANGEGGLLGMALHPDFRNQPLVFVAYNYYREGIYREKIVRYKYNGTSLINPFTLLDNIAASPIHNGCRLLFGPDGYLYISTGDASDQGLPQDTRSVNGKILRIAIDGSIPPGNPNPALPYWTYGHRNAQGLVFVNGKLFSSEHGPANDDEINIIEKGRNYGWPAVEGKCDHPGELRFCAAHNVREPIKTWTPTAAVCGLDYYNHTLIPGWKNSLLLVALKNARLYRLKLDDAQQKITGTEEYFTNVYGRLRDLCVSPAGEVFVCTSNGGGGDVVVRVSK